MQPQDVIRAWKDPKYKESLSPEQRDALPDPPADLDKLDDKQLEAAAGGSTPACIAAGAAVVSAAASTATAIDAITDD